MIGTGLHMFILQDIVAFITSKVLLADAGQMLKLTKAGYMVSV